MKNKLFCGENWSRNKKWTCPTAWGKKLLRGPGGTAVGTGCGGWCPWVPFTDMYDALQLGTDDVPY